MFSSYNKHNNRLYNKLVELSRNKYFYNQLKLNDNFETRVLLIFFHFIIILRLKKNINVKKKMQDVFDNIFHNIEINIRELGYGDTKVNNTMKSLNNIFYDILTKVDKKEFFLNNDILVLLNKYFYNSEKQDLKKSNDLAKYLDEFQNYCFDLDINNVLNGSLDFKFR